MTDKNGKVVFQNVPEGTYTLKVNESAGARLMMDPVIMVHNNINRKVSLVKNIRVREINRDQTSLRYGGDGCNRNRGVCKK